MLPPGWTAHDVSKKTEEQLLGQARQRLMPSQRVDLLGSLQAQVAAALSAARDNGAFLMVMPGPETNENLFAPASMLAMVREGTADYSLDDVVTNIVQERGGIALDENQRILRWTEKRTAQTLDGEMGAFMVFYLTPVPGSQRRKALQLALTIAHPTSVEPDTDEMLRSWVTLMDAHVSTFRWSDK